MSFWGETMRGLYPWQKNDEKYQIFRFGIYLKVGGDRIGDLRERGSLRWLGDLGAEHRLK